ncbi:MAG TPA: BON domain-containing protein [Syntrophaceticus sp.]|jgi:hyperosmotically inducible protein|nr:BON domain-containing protein [Syntrophaceticus sp.]
MLDNKIGNNKRNFLRRIPVTGQYNVDDELREQIRTLLKNDRNLGGYGLNCDVVEGEVQLQGIVDTLKEKEWAEDLVRQVSGVKGVANAVSISTDGSITDDEIIQEVQEELEGDPDGNLFNIGVGSVNRGKVVLAGRSNDPAEIEAAVKAASKARGVTEVISQVKQESGEDALTPEEIFHSQVNNDEE